jgi:hypothetical protein
MLTGMVPALPIWLTGGEAPGCAGLAARQSASRAAKDSGEEDGESDGEGLASEDAGMPVAGPGAAGDVGAGRGFGADTVGSLKPQAMQKGPGPGLGVPQLGQIMR